MGKTLVIKTKMDNAELTKQYNKLKRDMVQTLDEQERVNQKTKAYKSQLEEAATKYNELFEKASEYRKVIEELNSRGKIDENGKVWRDPEDVAQAEKLKQELKSMEPELEKLAQLQSTISDKIADQEVKETKVANRIKDINDKIDTTEKKIESVNNKTQNINFEGVSKGITKSITKIGKMAVALIGLRSIYGALQNSASTLANYNEDFKNKLETIKTTLALSLAPIVEKVVNWVYKLVQYAQYLIYALTGYDIFQGAKENLSSANKSAKELKKTLAGFDTANILSESGTTSGLSSDIKAMKELSDSEVPGILQDIKEHAEEVKIALLGLFAGATLIKIMNGISTLMGSGAALTGLAGLGTMLLILAAGVTIPLAVKGAKEVYDSMQGLKEQTKALNEISEKNLDTFDKLRQQYDEMRKSGELTTTQIKNFKTAIETQIQTSLDMIETGKLTDKQLQTESETIKKATSFYKNMYDQGLLNEEQQKDYKIYLEKTITALENNGQSVKDLRQDYIDLTGQNYETKCTITAEADTTKAENKLSNFWSKIGSSASLFLSFSDWGKGFGDKLKAIWNGRKLAVGGIVNNPGHGVPVGSAIAGEAGSEAVLPLTDPNTMARLGQEIGKWVNLQVNNVTKLDSRVVSRTLNKADSVSSFMRNGG